MEEQNNTMQPTAETFTEVNEQMGVEKGASNGAILGVVIITLVLLLGGIYFWVTQQNGVANTYSASNADLVTKSDEPAAIESDLNTFDSATLETQIDADMKAVESAF